MIFIYIFFTFQIAKTIDEVRKKYASIQKKSKAKRPILVSTSERNYRALIQKAVQSFHNASDGVAKFATRNDFELETFEDEKKRLEEAVVNLHKMLHDDDLQQSLAGGRDEFANSATIEAEYKRFMLKHRSVLQKVIFVTT